MCIFQLHHVCLRVYIGAMGRKKGKPMPATEAAPSRNREGKPVNIWVPEHLHGVLEAYIASRRPKPTKTAVVILALEEFLVREGFPPPAES